MGEGKSSGCGIVGCLAIAALLVVGMFAAGWIYLVQTETQTQIIIDKEEVTRDTNEAMDQGRKLMDRAAEGIEDATLEPEDKAEEAAEQPAPPAEGI